MEPRELPVDSNNSAEVGVDPPGEQTPPEEVAEVSQANDDLIPPGFKRLSSTATSTSRLDSSISSGFSERVEEYSVTEDLDRLAVGEIVPTTETNKPCDDFNHKNLSKNEEESHTTSDSWQRLRLDSDISSGFSDRVEDCSVTRDLDRLTVGETVLPTTIPGYHDDISKKEDESHNSSDSSEINEGDGGLLVGFGDRTKHSTSCESFKILTGTPKFLEVTEDDFPPEVRSSEILMSILLSNNGRKSFERKRDDKSITNSDKSNTNSEKSITTSIPTSDRVSRISCISGLTNPTFLDSSSDEDDQSSRIDCSESGSRRSIESKRQQLKLTQQMKMQQNPRQSILKKKSTEMHQQHESPPRGSLIYPAVKRSSHTNKSSSRVPTPPSQKDSSNELLIATTRSTPFRRSLYDEFIFPSKEEDLSLQLPTPFRPMLPRELDRRFEIPSLEFPVLPADSTTGMERVLKNKEQTTQRKMPWETDDDP
jgi:hypothetical protein